MRTSLRRSTVRAVILAEKSRAALVNERRCRYTVVFVAQFAARGARDNSRAVKPPSSQLIAIPTPSTPKVSSADWDYRSLPMTDITLPAPSQSLLLSAKIPLPWQRGRWPPRSRPHHHSLLQSKPVDIL